MRQCKFDWKALKFSDGILIQARNNGFCYSLETLIMFSTHVDSLVQFKMFSWSIFRQFKSPSAVFNSSKHPSSWGVQVKARMRERTVTSLRETRATVSATIWWECAHMLHADGHWLLGLLLLLSAALVTGFSYPSRWPATVGSFNVYLGCNF